MAEDPSDIGGQSNSLSGEEIFSLARYASLSTNSVTSAFLLFLELVLASITAVIICSGVMIFFSRSILACIAAKLTRSGQRGEM